MAPDIEETAIRFETMGFLSFAGTPDTNDTVTIRESFVLGTRRSNSRSSAYRDRATVLLFILLVLYLSRGIAGRAIKTSALLQPMTEVIRTVRKISIREIHFNFN